MSQTHLLPRRRVRPSQRQPFLRGERVDLRPLQMEDVDGPYRDWLNDYEVTRFLETGTFPTARTALEQYVRSTAQHPDNVMLAIVDRATEAHIGNIKLGPIHSLHRRADIGILIGEARFRGKGYGREAIELMLGYGFDRLNLHKITLGVYADHEAAVKLYQQLGFTIEGTLKAHLFRDGQFRDKYVMGLLREQYEARARQRDRRR